MASETLLCIFSTLSCRWQPQGNDNLALPQRNGAEDRCLDLIHQHFVVVLDEADLRRCLDSDGLAQLQVVDLFFKAVYRVLEIPHHLGAHGVALSRRFGAQLRQGGFLQFL